MKIKMNIDFKKKSLTLKEFDKIGALVLSLFIKELQRNKKFKNVTKSITIIEMNCKDCK